MSASAKQLRDLLLWARKERIVLSSVTIQGITVTVERDYGLVPPAGQPAQVERKQSIYEQYGGALLSGVHGQSATPAPAENEPTEEDE